VKSRTFLLANAFYEGNVPPLAPWWFVEEKDDFFELLRARLHVNKRRGLEKCLGGVFREL
jgi:hypothetical protein